MREMIHLASMEMRSENSEDIAIFLGYLMKCLRRLVEFLITSSTQDASYVMKQMPTIKQ